MVGKALLEPGDRAPDFALPDQDGEVRRLSDFAGRRLVLFFYPRADTPGCTLEAQDFSAKAADFDRLGVTVIGISADPPRKLTRFRDKHGLTVPLLSDESHETLNTYGVWGEKSMYGKTFEGIARTTFAIGADRRIAAIWRNVKVPGHVDAVFNSARNDM